MESIFLMTRKEAPRHKARREFLHFGSSLVLYVTLKSECLEKPSQSISERREYRCC